MSREIDLSKKLSDEDKLWLHERSQDHVIAENERLFGKKSKDDDDDNVEVDIKAVMEDAGLEVPELAPNPRVVEQPASVVAEEEAEDEEDLDSLTVEELKEELRDLDQPTSGTKAELLARLKKALK